jgi:hypothetical protein
MFKPLWGSSEGNGVQLQGMKLQGEGAGGEQSLEALFLSAAPTRRGPVRDSVPLELADLRERGTYIFRAETSGATDPGIVRQAVGQTMRRLYDFITKQPAVADYFGFSAQVTNQHMLVEVPTPPNLTARHRAVPQEVGLAQCAFEEVGPGSGEADELSAGEFVGYHGRGVVPLQRPHDYGHAVGLSQMARQPFRVISSQSGRARTEARAAVVGDMIEVVTGRLADYVLLLWDLGRSEEVMTATAVSCQG